VVARRGGLRRIADGAGAHRETSRRYIEAAVAAGLDRDAGEDQLTDELILRCRNLRRVRSQSDERNDQVRAESGVLDPCTMGIPTFWAPNRPVAVVPVAIATTSWLKGAG
jgi:hypothetical protein